MSRISLSLSFLAVLAFAVSLSGCGDQADSPDSKPDKQDSAADPHAGHDHGQTEEQSKIAIALSKLSPADRAAAEKQKICPVTGQLLGSMGRPLKVTVKGRDVFLCCQGCVATIRKDPDKYLAKLK